MQTVTLAISRCLRLSFLVSILTVVSSSQGVIVWDDNDNCCDSALIEGQYYRSITAGGAKVVLAGGVLQDTKKELMFFVRITNLSTDRKTVIPQNFLVAVPGKGPADPPIWISPVKERPVSGIKFLLANTVLPGQSVEGFLRYKVKKPKGVLFAAAIGKTKYGFTILDWPIDRDALDRKFFESIPIS